MARYNRDMARPSSLDYEKYTKDLMYHLYIEENLSRGEMCERLGIPEHSLRQILKHWGIVKSPELRLKCQKKGIAKKAETGWYRDESIKRWGDPEMREYMLKKAKASRTEEWRRHISEGLKGKPQTESQKQKMRELWKQGRWDFFKTEEFWKDRRSEYSERTKMQFANMTEDEYTKWKESLKKSLNSPATRRKRSETIIERESWIKSQDEKLFYSRVAKLFPDVRYQYCNDDYPWLCDFYIPSIDLWIELNIHWTHGGHPYSDTEEDKKLVEFWKSKKNKYYDNAIQAWTVRDVKKRTLAKERGLKYVELFSWAECEDFFVRLECGDYDIMKE